MRWKLVLFGGLIFYVSMWILSMATGPLVHEGLLKATYQATASFWRPELMKTPPDMGALMPRWISTGLLASFVQVWIYGVIEPSLGSSGWRKGLLFGLLLGLFGFCWGAGYSGVFNLPDRIWVIWGLEGFAYYLPSGALLGWVAVRFRW